MGLVTKLKENFAHQKRQMQGEADERKAQEARTTTSAGHSDQADPEHIQVQEDHAGHSESPQKAVNQAELDQQQQTGAPKDLDGGVFGNATEGSGAGFGSTEAKHQANDGTGFGSGAADVAPEGQTSREFAPQDSSSQGELPPSDRAQNEGGGFGDASQRA